MKKGQADAVQGLELLLPDGIVAVSPLVRSRAEGAAFLEVVARAPVESGIELSIDGRRVGTKDIVAGTDPTRRMQPERVSGFWASWLWPAEDTFGPQSPVAAVKFAYPERNLRLLPGGPLGILIVFFLASIVFGIAILKPLNIQI